MKNKNKKGNQFSKGVKDSFNVGVHGLTVEGGGVKVKVDKEDYEALDRFADRVERWLGFGKEK